jgi:hypothetical protein
MRGSAQPGRADVDEPRWGAAAWFAGSIAGVGCEGDPVPLAHRSPGGIFGWSDNDASHAAARQSALGRPDGTTHTRLNPVRAVL